MTSGGREALKWLALILMTGDHFNAGLLGRSVPMLYDLGRLVMPAFAAVLAFNLARPGADYRKAFIRLSLVGAIAYPFHVLVLGQGWYTLNILFGYALAVACMWLIEHRGTPGALAAGLLVAFGGLFVEFFWAAPLVTLAWWFLWRRPSSFSGICLGVSLGLLCLVNGNAWALGSVPLVYLACRFSVAIPRSPRAFWIYYPTHLAILALVAMW